MSGTINDDALIGGLRQRVRELYDRIAAIRAQMTELHGQRVSMEQQIAALQNSIAALGGQPETFQQKELTLEFAPWVVFPPGFPLIEAISGVLSGGEVLHRDDIVSRLSGMGYPWGDGEPLRMVGTTLGKNRNRFEEVGDRRWRLVP